MEITNIQHFLETFFHMSQCKIINKSQGTLTVQLTEEMDQMLMNRPFYWHFIKSTGQKGEPMTITLSTKYEEKNDGEWVHFGSPRLQQIMNYLRDHHKYIKLFQQAEVQKQTPLYPWLLTNIKVSYEGQQKKEEIFSIGLNLVNGMMKTEMMHLLRAFDLRPSIPNFCYTISPLIKLNSGFQRIEQVLDDYVQNQEHQWAHESLQTLQTKIDMVHHFFQDKRDSKLFENEIKALRERYTPKISYEVINGGLLYLMKSDFP